MILYFTHFAAALKCDICTLTTVGAFRQYIRLPNSNIELLSHGTRNGLNERIVVKRLLGVNSISHPQDAPCVER